MKHLILAAGLAFATIGSAQATDVGVSISLGQPGFYGQIDIGNYSRPRVIYAEPVVMHRAPRMVYEPVYLRVPPGHQKNWRKHCGRYDACGRPVYFVRDDWYRNEYAPRYRRDHDHRDRDHGRGDGRRDDRHDRHDGRRDDHPGRGHGKGGGRD
ncbi:hypothetical protein PEC18_17450 [Paucibacter sp. O1-1]|nr:hypothetical protein [Paucibacter sp. O1-1]MDA3827585.1 hypothetical protein [Paucibacter sp. O1-1]